MTPCLPNSVTGSSGSIGRILVSLSGLGGSGLQLRRGRTTDVTFFNCPETRREGDLFRIVDCLCPRVTRDGLLMFLCRRDFYSGGTGRGVQPRWVPIRVVRTCEKGLGDVRCRWGSHLSVQRSSRRWWEGLHPWSQTQMGVGVPRTRGPTVVSGGVSRRSPLLLSGSVESTWSRSLREDSSSGEQWPLLTFPGPQSVWT